MKLIVFGATDHVGSRVLTEALSRGHDVTVTVGIRHMVNMNASKVYLDLN